MEQRLYVRKSREKNSNNRKSDAYINTDVALCDITGHLVAPAVISQSHDMLFHHQSSFVYWQTLDQHGGLHTGSCSRGSSSSSSSRLPSSELSPMGLCSTPPPRQRVLSEPWLTIHNLACLNQAYEEGMSKRSPQDEEEDEEEDSERDDDEEGEDVEPHSQRRAEVQRRDDRYGGENYISCRGDFLQRVSQSVLSLTEMSSSQVTPRRPDPGRCVTAGGSPSERLTPRRDSLPACLSPSSRLRRNTLPSVTVFPPPLHLPPLVHRSDSRLQVPTQRPPFKSRSMVFLPHPPSYSPPSSSSSSSRASLRAASLPPLPLASSVTSLVAPPASSCSERSRRSPRRHSVQLEQIGGRL